MDYVQEELLRQRTLCSVLLGAHPVPEETEEFAESDSRTVSDSRGGPDRKRVQFRSLEGHYTEERRSTPLRTDPTVLNGERRDPMLPPEFQRRGAVLQAGQAELGRHSEIFPEQAPAVHEVGLPYETAGEMGEAILPLRKIPGIRTMPAAQDAPERISRAFQRDARRYDGGFSMN